MTFLDVSQGAVLIKYTPRSPVSLLCNTYSDPLAATSYPKTLTPHLPPSASSSLGLEFTLMPALKPAATVLSSTTHAKKKKEVKKE